MAVPEMVAEKLRALAQRARVADLADLAEMLVRDDVRDEDVARLAIVKFELVKQGSDNRSDRIEQHLGEMSADYDDVVPGLFPGAPSYPDAGAFVAARSTKHMRCTSGFTVSSPTRIAEPLIHGRAEALGMTLEVAEAASIGSTSKCVEIGDAKSRREGHQRPQFRCVGLQPVPER